MMPQIIEAIQNKFSQYNHTITQISKDCSEINIARSNPSELNKTKLFYISPARLFNFEDFCNTELSVKDYSLVDAMFFYNDIVVFVEFKSGKNIKLGEIRLKIMDSIVLFYKAMLEKLNIDTTCNDYSSLKKVYVVVYDNTKNSPQRTSAISCHFTNMPIRFNLEFYNKCFLSRVHTPSCGEFSSVMRQYGINI